MLLAIDPSKSPARTGWAIFDRDTHELVACGTRTPAPPWLEGVTHAVIERPRIYPHGRTPNPNDIVTLAWSAGEHAGALRARGVDVRDVEPRTWKGTLDKAVCMRRVWSKLTPAEQAVADIYQDNDHVLDAIGIGLHAIGRFSR